MADQQPLFRASALADEELAGLAAWLAPLTSRRAQWELLTNAGALNLSLARYRKQTRAATLVDALRAMAPALSVDAVRVLLTTPPPVPVPRVAVSTLAQQYYCDQQVHLGTQHEVRVSSRALSEGSAGHAVLESAAEPITDAEISRRIASGESMGLVEVPMTARIDGIDVFGRADRVQLEGRRAEVLLEFKFSSRRELFPSHVAQVQGYGELLSASGFETDRLVHAVAVIDRGNRGAPAASLADELAAAARRLAGHSSDGRKSDRAPAPRSSRGVDPFEGLSVRRLDADNFALHVFSHDPSSATRTLRWALSYWKGERAPVPTDSPGKCRACPFNAAGLCEFALAPHDGRYAVQSLARPGKRVLHLLRPAR